ncbi:hypothetical protein PAXINDRAFT_16471 [Paxillus involutus ATCC 200175]|uniref:CCHC-type domain-containing protein n=1 Tax=Paxillus involutus ATCC 200175 TaxID=664439 RepID=A0A0C9SRL6_PAXIN|nr:hypothetical protein PAXINDRAFT_16471 [Paxillus involutus ATCC 200175]
MVGPTQPSLYGSLYKVYPAYSSKAMPSFTFSHIPANSLSPSESSLKNVVNAAEVIEIAHSVDVSRDRTKPRDRDRSARSTPAPTQPSNSKPGRANQHGKGMTKDSPLGRNEGNPASGSRPDRGRFSHDKKPGTGFGKSRPSDPRGPRLTKEEHDKLAAEGCCFNCKETGHTSRNCPRQRTVASNGGTGPPGMLSYHIHLDTDTERLLALAESTETMETLTLNAMWIQEEEDPVDRLEAESGVRPGRMGDPLAWRAEEVLRTCTPYPEDDVHRGDVFDRERFSVYHVSIDEYVINDSHKPFEESVLVPVKSLLNRDFCVANYYTSNLATRYGISRTEKYKYYRRIPMSNAIGSRIVSLLSKFLGVPGKENTRLPRFTCIDHLLGSPKRYEIVDCELYFRMDLPVELATNPKVNLVSWYNRRVERAFESLAHELVANNREVDILRWLFRAPLTDVETALDELACNLLRPLPDVDFVETTTHYIITELNGVQVPMGTYPALQRNSSVPKDFKRVIPKPVVIVVNINGRPARALVDTGSLLDFMSSTLAEQLHLPRIELSKPLSVQLAVQGSRSKVNFGTKVLFEYQRIKTEWYFNIDRI